MKQKLWAMAAAAALALSLAGCMPPGQDPASGSGEEPDSQTEQTGQNGQTGQDGSGDGGQTAGQSSLFNRGQNGQEQEPEKVDLTVKVNGRDKTVEAEVYTGGRYTIAIPVEDWTRDPNEPQWNCKDNDDVELTIRYYTGKKKDDALKLLQEDEDDFTFRTPMKATLGESQEATRLVGKETEQPDVDEGETEPVVTELTVYFVEVDQGCYALLLECPETEKDSWGGYLTAMADTFTIVQPENRSRTMMR